MPNRMYLFSSNARGDNATARVQTLCALHLLHVKRKKNNYAKCNAHIVFFFLLDETRQNMCHAAQHARIKICAAIVVIVHRLIDWYC